jgi:hypothetical protein
MPLGLSLGLARLGGLRAALDLNLTSGFLDSRVTFTRASTATFVGSNGLIQSAAINAPRFDYDPVTLAAKGLLIEEQRTNLMAWSEEFDNEGWGKNGATISANAIAAPNGTVTANKIIPTAVSVEHYSRQIITFPAGSTVTASVFVKASGYQSIRLRCLDLAINSNGFQGSLDTSTQTTAGNVLGLGTFLGVSATYFNNDWWRISISGSAGATATSIIFDAFVLPGDQNSSSIFIGDGTSGLFLWGAQFEVGAFATSYIPTVASTVTRSADIATMTGTNFSSWYNQTEGTFVAICEASSNTYTTYLAASNGVVAQNSMHIDNDAGNMRAVYYSGSAVVALLSLGAIGTIGAVNKVATAYKANDFAASRNGGTVVTDTVGAVPVSVNRLNIGADPSGAAVNVTNTHIRSIAYYNTRLSNATLQMLTA